MAHNSSLPLVGYIFAFSEYQFVVPPVATTLFHVIEDAWSLDCFVKVIAFSLAVFVNQVLNERETISHGSHLVQFLGPHF